MAIPVLRFRDIDGNIVSFPAIKGEKAFIKLIMVSTVKSFDSFMTKLA